MTTLFWCSKVDELDMERDSTHDDLDASVGGSNPEEAGKDDAALNVEDFADFLV